MGVTIKTKVRVRVNGKEYDSLDDAPPEIREAYQKSGLQFTTGRITINGKTYGSVDELPAELRHRYEEIMNMARDGAAPQPEKPGTSFQFQIAPATQGEEYAPAGLTPSSSTRAFLVVTATLVLLGLLYWAYV